LLPLRGTHALAQTGTPRPPRPRNNEVLTAALRAALQRLMAVGAPDGGRVALVVRQMVGAAASDEARLAVYE
jgi:hypothetical protein